MPYWLRKIYSDNLKLLLPLPLILIAFGIGGESLTNQLLSRSYSTANKLQADTHTVKAQLAVNASVTAVEIEQEQDCTKVELKTANSLLKKLQFEVPVTELNSAKVIIAQEMGQIEPVGILQTGRQIQIRSAFKVLGILAKIDKTRGVTSIHVNTANSTLQKLELEFPVTDLSKIKATLTQQLGLSREDIGQFVSYRVKN